MMDKHYFKIPFNGLKSFRFSLNKPSILPGFAEISKPYSN